MQSMSSKLKLTLVADYGGRNLGINYSSEVIKDRDYSRRRKSNSDYCSKRKADYSSTSDSDELEAYMKDLNRRQFLQYICA